jgi:toluene monooxygenase system protein E
MTSSLPRKTQLKTFSHLAGERRLPSEYQIGSSRLHWYPERGFEVATPLGAWYEQHQSLLGASNWERFADPRATTYASYTRLQAQQETFVDALMQSIEDQGYDARLQPAALLLFDRVLAPLRFPLHGLELLAAYVGQMAPAGRITIAAAFQSADEVRRIQRIAYRLALLARTHAEVGRCAREAWQSEALWQPLRKLVEELLVVWDWGECFAALNLSLKPRFDELFIVGLARVARDQGDPLLAELLDSLGRDGRWHREWAAALVKTAVADRAENAAVLERWTGAWDARVAQALAPFARELEFG